MSFETVNDVDQILRSRSVSVRDLHAVWDQRLPVADSGLQKKSAAPLATGRQIAWLQDVAIGRQFTRHAVAQEEYLLALDAAKEILRLPADGARDTAERLRVMMDCAAALTRLGFTGRAHEELQPGLAAIKSQGVNLRVDFLLQLGDIAREASYHAATRAERHDAASRALGFYRSALGEDAQRLVAMVRIAATLLTLGEPGGTSHARSQDVARDILALVGKVEKESGTDPDTVEARATASAILGNDDTAMRSFEALRGLDGITTSQLAEARFRARHLAQALGKPRDFFKAAFPPLQLIVFSGHLPDLPDAGGPRREPRLPQDAVGVVREALQASLDSLQARVGLVSASAGADLLFIEALRERQGTVHIVLPWEQEEFRRTSVQRFDPPGGPSYWEPLFDRALREAATVRTIGQAYEPGRDDVGWEYLMEVTAGVALQTARASRLDIQPMVLWNERPAYGPGGTDSFFGFWSERLKQEPINVMPQHMRQRREESVRVVAGRAERSVLRQEVKSMLFADIVGYSKLSEKVIPEFIGTFLDRLSKLVATSKHPPCYVNTWGDAIYAVFDYAHDAGLFALELAQMLATGENDWLGKGLYWEEPVPGDKPARRALNIRIGLHTGPVFVHYDPVLRRIGFTGSHVSRAARIEPVTRPGEVFASEEFAALAKLGTEMGRHGATAGAAPADEGFDCEYAGSMPLAKGYPGRFRIYRVVPVRSFGIEDLAKAAHERYVEEALASGKTPAAGNAVHPWEELAEDFRDASRALVADIPNKLRLLGYELTPGHGIAPSSLPITAEQLEQQAMREHDRWLNERVRSGWTYAPVRDNARKHHPCIVSWEELPEEEKKKDRTAVLMMPGLIERAGFKVRRLGG